MAQLASQIDADVLIVGGGHAGLAAALTLYRAQHTNIIFNSKAVQKSWACPTHSVPGWENQDPEEIKEKTRSELRAAGLTRFVDTAVKKTEKGEDGLFRVTGDDGRIWTGRKMLLAIGKDPQYPKIMGYDENFSKGIYHCMLTFGYEQRNTASAGMLAREHLSTPFHLAMVLDDTQKFVHTVTVYTDSNPSLASELAPILKERGARLDDRKIASLEKGTNDSEMVLRFEDGSSSTEGFLVHQPYSKVNEDLVSGLGLELDDWGDIKVAPLFCSTSVPGLYAAGDCASMMKTILNALSMGTCAGAGIARELPIRVTGHSLDWADRVMALREKEGVVKA